MAQATAVRAGRARRSSRRDVQPLEQLSFYIGRAYYNYKLLLERTLVQVGLDRYVSAGMGHILFTLFERDDCIIKDVAERTKLSLPTITVMLRRMEQARLLELRRDPDDGRAVRVKLTPLGRSIEPRCHVVLERLNSVLESGMSRGDVRRLRKLMSQMIDSMLEDEASGGSA